jgi:hypothetical protein
VVKKEIYLHNHQRFAKNLASELCTGFNYVTGKVSLRLMAKRMDKMLTVKEAAAKIGSPEASIRVWLNRGDFQARVWSKRLLVHIG